MRSTNLNLIPVLRALLREVSVTDAGVSLGLSPSAVSCALADLRVLMGDPLLVRVGRSMRLTARAEQLAAKLEHACHVLEELLQEEAFDPATASRTFIVSAVDYVAMLVGPPLVQRMREAAPGIRIRFVDVPQNLEQLLAQRQVDLALVALNHLDWTGVSAASSWRDEQVGVVDARHPLAGSVSVTEDQLASYPAAGWAPGVGLSARAAAVGLSGAEPGAPAAQVTVHSNCALPLMILGTDMVARVPGALARRLSTLFPLHVFALPEPRTVIETGSLWSIVQDADPAHRWVREQIQDVLAQAHN